MEIITIEYHKKQIETCKSDLNSLPFAGDRLRLKRQIKYHTKCIDKNNKPFNINGATLVS